MTGAAKSMYSRGRPSGRSPGQSINCSRGGQPMQEGVTAPSIGTGVELLGRPPEKVGKTAPTLLKRVPAPPRTSSRKFGERDESGRSDRADPRRGDRGSGRGTPPHKIIQ